MSEPLSAVAIDAAAKETASKLGPALLSGIKHLKGAVHAKFEIGLEAYLSASAKRYSTVKTIIHTSPTSFNQLYVNQYLQPDGMNRTQERLTDKAFIEDNSHSATIIAGTAGSGKSMFMRYCALHFLLESRGSLPIFIELRRVNAQKTVDLLAAVLERLQEHISDFSSQLLKKLVAEGRVIFLLDGFDEVDFDKRHDLNRQINQIRHQQRENRIIISTRPNEGLLASEGFAVFNVAPLSQGQLLTLIDNLRYDEDVSAQFKSAISDGSLYDTHRSFVTIPLLATMMLLTFEQHASIPSKMHLFYNAAFETLFVRHDAKKDDLYRRKRYTNLDIDKFKNIVANFSASTYARELLSFDNATLLSFLRSSIHHEGESANVTPEAFLMDLEESVCILQKDGLQYTFTHRSFQEYFCAYFLSRIDQKSLGAAIEAVSLRHETDNVMRILTDIARDAVENEWVIPTLSAFIAEYNSLEQHTFCDIGPLLSDELTAHLIFHDPAQDEEEDRPPSYLLYVPLFSRKSIGMISSLYAGDYATIRQPNTISAVGNAAAVEALLNLDSASDDDSWDEDDPDFLPSDKNRSCTIRWEEIVSDPALRKILDLSGAADFYGNWIDGLIQLHDDLVVRSQNRRTGVSDILGI